MREFFLPQPASWPGTPFAALRMTNKYISRLPSGMTTKTSNRRSFDCALRASLRMTSYSAEADSSASLRNDKSKAEEGAEVMAGVGRGVGGDLFGGSGGDDLAAGVTAFGAEVDDPVGGLDYV